MTVTEIVKHKSQGVIKAIDVRKSTPPAQEQKKRPNFLLRSFILCVIVPFLLVASYYAFIASDRYASTAGFSVRGIENSSGLDGLGTLTGLASTGSTTSDSYIVLQYLESRALVEALDADLNLRQVYTNNEIDWFSRMDSEATIEEFSNYWLYRIQTEFDPMSTIIKFTVQSFSPEHAVLIAERIMALTQELVNELSATARQDALRFAEREVAIQEQRLRSALDAIRIFRSAEQSLNPAASATLDIELLANLEARLIDMNARIAVQSQTLNGDAPSLVALKRQAEALEQQIKKRKAEIGSVDSNAITSSEVTNQLNTFETLDLERRFAEHTYASALDSLEQARRDADSQQRYLAVHMFPQIAEKSEYPQRIRNSLIAAFLLCAIWAIGALITYSVRDHLT